MSEIKVNKISPRSGTAFTLGDSGDTFTIPSGATINNQGTAVNFGATGSASWVTTVKTSTFTAVAGEGYFVNTTGGAVTVNLPAGVAGAVVAVKDYANTFDTNACTLVQNGSDKVGGSTVNPTLITEGIAVTLVFVDATQGWLVTDSGLQSETPTALYVTATGGSVTCSGNFRIHTFTGPGSFCVSAVGNAAGSNTVDYMVVAGGGGGGGCGYGGGGGAGGYRESPGTASGSYTVSPLGASPAVALPVPATSYPIQVGSGGAGGTPGAPNPGVSGSSSSFSSITSTGGGGGGGENGTGIPGGSGGASSYGPNNGGTGNTPPVNPAQGTNGATQSGPAGSTNYNQGGGGGATVAGIPGPSSASGAGGAGATSSINGTPTARSGGGGAGTGDSGVPGAGGAGGGGNGGSAPSGTGVAGTINTGGGAGGGGGGANGIGGAGGSGIVIIRYKFQN